MSWFGETNPHFWSSSTNQPHTPTPHTSPPRPAQQPPENIQPVRVIRQKERPHQLPHPSEPNPHFWPRDRRQSSEATDAPSGLTNIKPEKRRPKERLDHVKPGIEPNPPFWPKDRHPSPPYAPSGSNQQTVQQPPSGIQPEKRINPNQHPSHQVQPPLVQESNPHLWPRDQQQAPASLTKPHKPALQPRPLAHEPDLELTPTGPTHPRHKHPSHQVQPPLVQESNPHLWPRDQQQAPASLTKPHKPELQPRPLAHEPDLELTPTGPTHPRHKRPSHQVQPPPIKESNPHLWPRDHPHAPTLNKPHRPTIPPSQQPTGLEAHEPTLHPGQQPIRPQASEPELQLIPTWPTRPEDRSPIHPTEVSQEHWPLHPEQGSQEGSQGQQRHQPKKKQPRIGPTKIRPPRKHDSHERPFKDENLMYPAPNRTNPCTWFIAIFCVILWVVVILGGILILIIYLVYRPRNPHFEIPNTTLNAAYLDMGYLLNADLVILINITNPNQKMNIDFDFANLKVQYENQPIANQYVGSFSVPKSQSKFATLEMVCSQIRLPVLVTQQLVKQIKSNRVTFQVEGHFHARSSIGGVFRYSYWIYSYCTIVTTGPPSGVIVASKCTTKR